MKRLDPEQRRRAAQTINSLGAVVSLQDLEEREEVLIPFDEDGRVLRGIYRGMQVREAEAMEVGHLLKQYGYVRRSVVTLCPWWRWWLNTRAVRLLAFEVAHEG
ncbi:hypothetical protein WDJ50_02685 [Deinococcus sp. VB142]|uniref:ParB/Sulfiredoxin domain-containing protein n=1 Tax=Deinococcus sp. VB142 TaxID=3112952 RepID=A0AAU6Q355_9DEIO